MASKLRIKKGDTVTVISGRDLGKRGEVLKVFPADCRVLAQGINVVKRHTRPTSSSAGGIIDKELPIHVSNVALVDPKSDGSTRVGYRVLEDGRKVRYAKRSGEIIDV